MLIITDAINLYRKTDYWRVRQPFPGCKVKRAAVPVRFLLRRTSKRARSARSTCLSTF